MVFGYIKLPAMLGVGRYTVTVELPQSGGLYQRANVTYRGIEVGRVKSVRLTDTGVAAVLSLRSGVAIPSDLDAEVHSENAIGEQYVALLPRNGTSTPLKNGDVIPRSRTSVPPDINSLLDATNRGLQAIPRDNLKTAIDEAYTAVGGLGPEIQRFVKGSTALAIDARNNLDPFTALIDQSQPVLDSQTDTSDAVRAWAAHLATITGQLQAQDSAVAGVLENGGAGRRRGPPALRATAADAADCCWPTWSASAMWRHLPQRPRTVAGVAAAGHRRHAGRSGAQPEHQAGLQGRVPELQPEPQPSAAVHHRLPTGPANASAVRPGDRPTGPTATCTAGYRKTRCSMCAARATRHARRARASAPRP